MTLHLIKLSVGPASIADLAARQAAYRERALTEGLRPEHVHASGACTACDAAAFYSWRRDSAQTGRMQAAIAPPARPA